MPNTLTLSNLAPVIYKARDIVARELTGAIPSVTINRDGTIQSAFGDKVQSFLTAQPTLNTSYTPAMTIPAADDQTVIADDFALDSVANVRIPITGETARKLDNSYGVDTVLADMFAQAIRRMVNTIEAKLIDTLYKGSSRAVKVASGTVFDGTNKFNILANARRILAENGCPLGGGELSVVLDPLNGARLRQLSELYKANESGGTELLRQGEILNLLGFSIKESAQVPTHTKGTLGGSPTITNTNFAVGTTSLTLSAAGTGSIVAGDALNIANDTGNIYIVKTGDTDVSDGGTVVLNAPGLRQATGASTRALTLESNYTPLVALHRQAAELAMRAPAQPYGGDAAVDRITLSDPQTGLNFEVAQYKGYGMAMFDITAFYGAKVWKPDFIATIIG
jgi:hypothetical protein